MMKTLSTAFMFLTLTVSPLVHLNAQETEYHNLEQMLGAIKLEKIQVETMVDTMQSSGRISAEEAERAKREIASVKEEDIEEIKNQALKHIRAKSLANKQN